MSQWNAVSPVKIQASSSGSNVFTYSTDERYFGPGVIAVTQLAYKPGKGKITDAKILMNQTPLRSFCLTADKSASVCTDGSFAFSKIYVGDVITHEFGHLLGLGHSEVRDSTMLFSTLKGHHTIHADDIAGIRTAYGLTGRGTIKGIVSGGSNIPVFGAHIQAISTLTGAVAASAISQENGTFSISNLPLGDTYYLYVEPLNNLSALPDAYLSTKNNFCPGDYVGSFFETCSGTSKGHPQPLALAAGTSTLNVGTITVRCALRVGEGYLREKVSTGGGLYEFRATAQKPGESFVGYYSSSEMLSDSSYSSTQAETIEIDLSQLAVPAGSPKLELKILTQALGSALDFSVEVSGPSGVQIDSDRGGVTTPLLETSTLRQLFNRKITYPLNSTAALNTFTVTLKPRKLTTAELTDDMPNASYFIQKDRPWLLIASVTNNQGAGQVPYYVNRTSSLADNVSCLDAPYAFAVRANPVSAAAMQSGGGDDTAPSAATAPTCATWGPPPGGGPGPWIGGMLLGFFVMLLPHRRKSH